MPGPSLREQLAQALAVVEQLRADNERLRAENEALRDRVAHLEAERSQDSSTSSKSPSTDPVGPRKKRAERRAEARAAKRAQGKQMGAPGASLARRPPDQTIGHEPVACRCCCACGAETVADFPPEARAPVCWGPAVRAFAVYLRDRQHLPVERTAELLADVLDAAVSTGWLCQIQAEAAGRLAPFLTALKARLAAEPVSRADETGTRIKTTKHRVHTVTTGVLTLLAVHPSRGVQALEDIGVLPGFTGTVVHDGRSPYEIYTAAGHAQCSAHLLRHPDDVGQTIAFARWTRQMTDVLLRARDAAARAAAVRAEPALLCTSRRDPPLPRQVDFSGTNLVSACYDSNIGAISVSVQRTA